MKLFQLVYENMNFIKLIRLINLIVICNLKNIARNNYFVLYFLIPIWHLENILDLKK